jgi:acetylornithine deacetylase/succinyl-diaminopimelate desuccinylase family protein
VDALELIDRGELVALLQELVAIPSVNPAYPPGSGERGLGLYVQDFFGRVGLPCVTQEVFPGRDNVIARLDGSQAGRTLLFEAHMDTVSVAGMTIDPFEPKIEGGRLYGRGSCDTKAGLAAMMYALKRIAERGIAPEATILLAATVDEEHAFRGVARLVESGLRADGAVVSEPTQLQVVVAHKGCVRWKIRTVGRAAHSSKVHLGINAVTKMAKALCVFEQRLGPFYARRQHPLLGGPTFNVGLIEGGIQVNTVPDSCTIQVDRRLLPGETREMVFSEFQEVLADLEREDPEFKAVMEPPLLEAWPLETAGGSSIVTAARKACGSVLGDGRLIGVPYGTNASPLSRAGIPSIVLGPGSIDQAHTAAEYVEIDQVVQAAAIYADIMQSF